MTADRPGLAVTWWGHASSTVELGPARIALDPLLPPTLLHLRRYAPVPGPDAAVADAVLVSHLHADHLHVPSLRRFGDVPLVVPRGGEGLVKGLPNVVAVEPGVVLTLGGVTVEVLPAHHDGHRLPHSRTCGPALGFRVVGHGHSFWYPGDTGEQDLSAVAGVDLAVVPIGGWGPSLGEHHLDPVQAAQAVGAVGARFALGVHWGTFWPRGLRRVDPKTYRHLFETPGARFAEALPRLGGGAALVDLPHLGRAVLVEDGLA